MNRGIGEIDRENSVYDIYLYREYNNIRPLYNYVSNMALLLCGIIL